MYVNKNQSKVIAIFVLLLVSVCAVGCAVATKYVPVSENHPKYHIQVGDKGISRASLTNEDVKITIKPLNAIQLSKKYQELTTPIRIPVCQREGDDNRIASYSNQLMSINVYAEGNSTVPYQGILAHISIANLGVSVEIQNDSEDTVVVKGENIKIEDAMGFTYWPSIYEPKFIKSQCASFGQAQTLFAAQQNNLLLNLKSAIGHNITINSGKTWEGLLLFCCSKMPEAPFTLSFFDVPVLISDDGVVEEYDFFSFRIEKKFVRYYRAKGVGKVDFITSKPVCE